ncbi:hypothetical protein AB1Y20_020796 [Prymnesium parvum]|uniref:DNA/RNA-binding protein Alba-like domain-containing protein n=1 Tax=Prymnesium parvum TaxID=97485 RepID=A0AB34JZ72_PRYPA
MANIDISLDDIISAKAPPRRAPGGRRAAPRAAAAAAAPRAAAATAPRAAPRAARTPRAAANTRAAPYRRGGAAEGEHMANASVADVAHSSRPLLKVKGESRPNTVAGAICSVLRQARGDAALAVLATGPAAINQAMKAMAIARKYLLEEPTPVDLVCTPVFEQDVRAGSNVSFQVSKSSKIIEREPLEEDLAAKEKTDVFKLAGAIAGRIRDGEEVAVTTKGAIPVLVVVKAIATAQDYLSEAEISLKFVVSIVDLENPEIRDATSTYLHFAIVSEKN